MENEMIFVTSASDYTIVINVPDMPLHRVWNKRGQKLPIGRMDLERAFYDPSVEYLFRQGTLITNDKTFLKDVGLMTEDEESEVFIVTESLLQRIIKLMPLTEVKQTLAKMSVAQRQELGEYAVRHYTDLKMDRTDLLSKATGKDILTAIKNLKAVEE